MADWDLIEDRVLSGKGVLRIPTDVRKGRAYTLISDVVRLPSSPYLNLNWNPPRGRYGNLVFLRNGYVTADRTIDFKKQSYDGIPDISGQNLLAIKCVYAGILQTFVNLGIALNVVPVSVENSIADYESLSLSWDEVYLLAYSDTAIQLRLYRVGYDVCDDANNDTVMPLMPELPVPEIPPGQSIEGLSPPYDPATSDNGNSVPYPGDTVPVPVKPCWALVGYGASSNNSPGIDLQIGSGAYPRWIRANTVVVSRFLISSGYYAGCYGKRFIIDGVAEEGFGAGLTAALDPNNPSCPAQ